MANLKDLISELKDVQARVEKVQQQINGTHEGARLIVIAFEIEKIIIPSLGRTLSRIN